MKYLRAVQVVLLLTMLVTAGCVSARNQEAVRVLNDIAARGGPSELKSMTPTPRRLTVTYLVDGRPGIADLYQPGDPAGAPLVLVPGFTREGKNDLRVVEFASSLARARFLVMVPDLAGSRELRVSVADARSIADAAIYLADRGAADGHQGVGIAAISYAVGPAVMASLKADVHDRIQFVVGIGGYYDTTAVVTFMTTGKYRGGPNDRWRFKRPHPAGKWIFALSNIDQLSDPDDRAALIAMAERRIADPGASIDDLAVGLGPEGRSLFELLTNRVPERVAGLIARLPFTVQRHLESLSLRHLDLSRLAGRLILIHGLDDTMIPHTESKALAAAAGNAELFLVEGFSHIDSTSVGLFGRLTLIRAMQALLDRRRPMEDRPGSTAGPPS